MAKVNGTGGVDNLTGTVNDDIFDGGFGADTMTGGLGSDIYYVDNAGDTIVENAGEGTEKVYSSVSYTLPNNVENLTLMGAASINATGNNWDNTLVGNKGNNILNGGGGSDTMIGGGGDDIYFINTFSADGINDNPLAGDYIIDKSGNDTVVAAGAGLTEIVYILQKGLENAHLLVTTADITLTGNTAKNILETSDGDDIIDGGKGADTMDGGDGANKFYVDHKGDVILDTFDDTDADGPTDSADTAYVSTSYVMSAAANIEYIELIGSKGLKVTGSDTANIITGNSAANTIHGGGGDDTIHGGGGKDILYGDLGADTFFFDADTAFTAPVTIKDFNIAQGDMLDISDILSGYTDGLVISGFVHIVDTGKNTQVQVNAAGDGLAAHYVTIATLSGVTGLTGEAALVAGGHLIMETA